VKNSDLAVGASPPQITHTIGHGSEPAFMHSDV